MKITDKKIILISISLSLFSLSFFLYYRPDPPINELSVVAKFSKTKNDVKRKMANSLDWKKVEEEDEIFSNDLLYTGDKSSSEIVYYSKLIKLKMPANTIIKIEVEDQKPTFDIKNGSLEIEVGEQINFNIKQDINHIKPAKISINEQGNITYAPPSNQTGKAEKVETVEKESMANNKLDDTSLDKNITGTNNQNSPKMEMKALDNKKREEKIIFYFLISFSLVFFILSLFA
jgi:hypothetical protein